MSDGCTDCGRKGGCDHRKQGMFEAIDQALERLYPSHSWGQRAETATHDQPASTRGPLVAERLAARLGTLTLFVPGAVDEYCDYVYVLCLGRTPSLLELREGQASAGEILDEAPKGDIQELYLRVALSSVTPFAAVQQVSVRGTRSDGGAGPAVVLIEEAPRTGVFDPVLLPRFKTLVAVLTELDLRHLDFGEITAAPAGFDAGDYAVRYGGAPAVANYLFYPQPASSITTTAVVLSHRGSIE